jgi:hypothetical protein
MKASKKLTTSPIPTLSPRRFVEDLEAALEQFYEIAADLGLTCLQRNQIDEPAAHRLLPELFLRKCVLSFP